MTTPQKSNRTLVTCTVTNSICSILSTMTGFAKNFILDFFPPEYFKSIHITTASASSQQAELEDDEVPIKQFPQLSINPSLLPDYDEVFGGPYPMWRRGIFETIRAYSQRYGYRKIFFNSEDDLIISAVPNRVKFSFDYKIKAESYLQKMEIVYRLRNKFHTNDKFYWNNQYFKSQIPNTIINAISCCKGLNPKNPKERDLLIQYLKDHSSGYIEPMLYTGDGHNSFVHNFKGNVLISVDNPPETDEKNVNKNNMATGEELVEFTLGMEIWIPSNFMFECNALPEGNYNNIQEESKVYIYGGVPLRPAETINDKSMFCFQEIVTEVNVPCDSINMQDFIESGIMEFINEQVAKKDWEYLKLLFLFNVYADRTKLNCGRDYEVDWKNKKINILNPFFNYTHYIAGYVKKSAIYEWSRDKRYSEK